MKRLHRLAINDEGFIFDPVTGESYTVNETGLAVLKGIKDGKPEAEIVADLQAEFEDVPGDADHDIHDFITVLRGMKLLEDRR
jgi:hypothetical protein